MRTSIETKKTIVREVNRHWPHLHNFDMYFEILSQITDEVMWVLVEKSAMTGLYHLSLHMNTELLEKYQVEQEHAENWIPLVAVNLNNASVWRLERGFTVMFDEPIVGLLGDLERIPR